jgi:2-hydroxychromene-2-carboxylate isomerase
MGEVISLDERRRARVAPAAARGVLRPAGGAPPATTLWFDLTSPSTYFAAERADRMFPGLAWRPVLALPCAPESTRSREAEVRAATLRAAELRMPLVWPESYPAAARAAMRVAAFAAERGQAPAFVLAASRLAFCGGFDLDDPEILAEAAAAAALPFGDCLRAAGDRSRDDAMEAAGHKLFAAGADRLPVLRVGRQLFCGEERLAQAAAAARASCGPAAPRDEFAG